MANYKATALATAQATINAEVAQEIQTYHHEAKVAAAARRQEIDMQLRTSVVRTPKPPRPSPVGSTPWRKRKVHVAEAGLDPSQPISIHFTTSTPSESAPSTDAEAESDSDLVMDDASTPRVSPTSTSLPAAPSGVA